MLLKSTSRCSKCRILDELIGLVVANVSLICFFFSMCSITGLDFLRITTAEDYFRFHKTATLEAERRTREIISHIQTRSLVRLAIIKQHIVHQSAVDVAISKICKELVGRRHTALIVETRTNKRIRTLYCFYEEQKVVQICKMSFKYHIAIDDLHRSRNVTLLIRNDLQCSEKNVHQKVKTLFVVRNVQLANFRHSTLSIQP